MTWDQTANRPKTITWLSPPGQEFEGVAYEIERYQDNIGLYSKVRTTPTHIIYRFRHYSDKRDVERDVSLHDTLAAFVDYCNNLSECQHCWNLIP